MKGRLTAPIALGSLGLLLSACASRPPAVEEDLPHWGTVLERPIDFQMLVNADLLVVGTLRHLYGMNPETGAILWRQRNVAVSARDLVPLDAQGLLLVNDAAGGAFHDRDTNIIAIEQSTGEIAWEVALVEGKILQGILDGDGSVFYFVNVPKSHGDDSGFLSGVFGKGIGSGYEQVPVLNALEVTSGRMLWTRPFATKVRMRPSYARQLDDKDDWSDTRPFDLDLFHPPVIAGDRLCVTYAGVHCYDRHTGEPLWEHVFDVIEDDLALSYAYPAVAGDAIIVTGENRVRAYDLATGKRLWQSERLDIVSELTLDEDVIFGQLGGSFLDLDGEEFEWEGDFGVVALDRQTGQKRWEFDSADDAVTNVLVLRDRVWVADEHSLYALDRQTGELRLKQNHDFDKPPEFAALNETGQVVLVGDGQAAAFDVEDGTQLWTVLHPPIGPGAWARFGEGLRRSTGNTLKFLSFIVGRAGGVLPSLSLPLGSVDFNIISTRRVVSNQLGRSGRRMAYRSAVFDRAGGNANVSGNFQYFVTRPEGYDKPALAVVNLATGETERLIRMDTERPNLVIDEPSDNVYQAFDQQLVALPLHGGSTGGRVAGQVPPR